MASQVVSTPGAGVVPGQLLSPARRPPMAAPGALSFRATLGFLALHTARLGRHLGLRAPKAPFPPAQTVLPVYTRTSHFLLISICTFIS